MIKKKTNKINSAIIGVILLLIASCASQVKAPIEGLGPDSSYSNNAAAIETNALTLTKDLTSSDIGEIYNAAQYTQQQQKMMISALKAMPCKTINFAFDSTALTDETQACLQKVADYLLQYQQPIRLAGHTDPIGSEKYNLNLGQRRADSVRQYLLQQGVDTKQICTVSYGKSQPAAAPEQFYAEMSKDEARIHAYYLDRRVELQFGQMCG